MFGAAGHLPELIIILVIGLLILGPGKLPQLGGAVGKTIKEFRKGAQEAAEDDTAETAAKPAASEAATPVGSKVEQK